MTGDVTASPIDEEDMSPVGAFERIQRYPVAPLGRVVRGPDNRQGARIEQRGEPVAIVNVYTAARRVSHSQIGRRDSV
jgi:hypothetical protein